MKLKKIILVIMLFLAGLWLVKNQLHHFGSEDSEIARTLYVLEASFNPRLITHVDTGGQKLVALTFDDGPDPRFTPLVLDILKSHGVKATFFVVGESAAVHPDLIRREIAEGHEVENHTYTHPDLTKDNVTKTAEEISRAGEIIKKISAHTPHYFRPPKRLFKNETIDIADINGYKTILWSICVEHQASKTAEAMARRVTKAAAPGTIILAHDGRLDRSQTIIALPLVIAGYQEQGYQFVTMDELLKAQQDKTKI